jgi:hypothetical protein
MIERYRRPICTLVFASTVISLAAFSEFASIDAATTISTFGTPGHSVTGTWTDLSPFIPGGESLAPHFQAAPGNGATSTWDFTGLANGNYYLAASWYAEPNRTIVASYAISDGGGNVTVNQQSLARDVAEIVDGKAIGWKRLNTVPIAVSDGTLSVTVSDDDLDVGAGGFLIADSIRLSDTPLTATPSSAKVIDVGQPGHQFLGEGPTGGSGGGPAAWDISGTNNNAGYNGSHHFDNEDNFANHSGALISEWTFTGLAPGVPHTVAATWVSPDANRATNSPFTISGIVGGNQTVMVNQELVAAADYAVLDDNGAAHPFQRLGRFTPTGTTLTVRLTNNADQFVIADAIRVEGVPEPSSVGLVGCILAALLAQGPRARHLRWRTS